MVWTGFQIGLGLFLFGLVLAAVVWVLAMGIDGLDWWSSRLSPDEAARRAKLASVGKWPPPDRPWRQPLDWIVLAVAVGVIVLLQMLYRWLR